MKRLARPHYYPTMYFCTLFEKAHEQVRRGNALLDIQDDLERVSAERNGQVTRNIQEAKNRRLVALGWAGGLGEFNQAIQSLRTASYIVIASTSGCRNHELANVMIGAHHSTEDDEGTVYHWLRSSRKKPTQVSMIG
ncbi:hypothetical protein ULF88_24765 [Halopseudomonas pachastrellae]|nr:hypothetical protein [Halopseudomonas pachastrellae]